MKKSFTEVRRGLNEELTHKKLSPMVDSFVSFASKDLGIKSLPKVDLIPQGKESRSFGGYSPADNRIMIVTKNRHPMDIFRTLAHELVHCKQCEDGKIGKDIRKEGETGSPQENEANAMAGVLMRNWGRSNPDMFDSSYVTEQTLKEDLRQWLDPNHPKGGWKKLNSKGEPIGPCAREEPGEPKPKCMSNEMRRKLTKDERADAVAAKRKHDPNPERKGEPINVSNFGKGRISEMEIIAEKNQPTNPELWSRAKSLAKKKFDVYPSAYANGWASKWYKSKGGGWKTVSEQNVFEARRKRKDTEPDQENLPMSHTANTGGVSKVGYPTKKLAEDQLDEISIKDLARKALGPVISQRMMERRRISKDNAHALFRKYGTNYNKAYKETGLSPRNIQKAFEKHGLVSIDESVSVWTDRKKLIKHIKDQGWSEDKARSKKHKIFTHPDYEYHLSVPHGNDIKYGTGKEIFQGALGKKPTSMVRENLDTDFEMFLENAGEWGTDELAINYTDATPGQEYWKGKKKKKKKDVNEDYAAPMWYGFGNSDGKSGLRQVATRNTPMASSGFTGAGPSIPMAEEKPKKKSIKAIRNEGENNLYYKEQGLPTNKGPDNFVPFTPAGVGAVKEEKSAAWQRKEGKDPEGGLNRKGVASYRRQNPGSKLKMAVTTPPSKLDPKGTAAKRRKSFCARMSGMPGPMKDEKGRPTRKALSLRKWNCE